MSDVEIFGELTHETDDAFLVEVSGKPVWLPKSQTEWDGKSTFTIPEWLAEKRELL